MKTGNVFPNNALIYLAIYHKDVLIRSPMMWKCTRLTLKDAINLNFSYDHKAFFPMISVPGDWHIRILAIGSYNIYIKILCTMTCRNVNIPYFLITQHILKYSPKHTYAEWWYVLI